MSSTIVTALFDINRETNGDVFFTIIRNPYSRLYSAYNQKNNLSSDPLLKIMMTSENFEDFVVNKLSLLIEQSKKNTFKGNITHILPQSNFFINDDDHCQIHLIKYEKISTIPTWLNEHNIIYNGNINFNICEILHN